MRHLRQLRLPMLVVLAALTMGLLVPIYYSAKGWYLIIVEGSALEDNKCRPLLSWLMEYIFMLPLSSLSFGLGGIVCLVWAIRGGLLRSTVPGTCRAAAPGIWSLVDELMYAGFVTCGCVAIGLLFMLVVVHRVRSIHRRTVEIAIDGLLANSVVDVAPTEEGCVICLEGPGDNAAAGTWRRLQCGHVFHEACLRMELQHRRRCPVCRRNLDVDA